MEGMKTLDIRSYREIIKAAVARERQADPNWSWGVRSITKGIARIGWGYLDYPSVHGPCEAGRWSVL